MTLETAPGQLDLHIHMADPRRALELPQFELLSDQALGLAHDGADDVLMFDDPIDVDRGSDSILHRARR